MSDVALVLNSLLPPSPAPHAPPADASGDAQRASFKAELDKAANAEAKPRPQPAETRASEENEKPARSEKTEADVPRETAACPCEDTSADETQAAPAEKAAQTSPPPQPPPKQAAQSPNEGAGPEKPEAASVVPTSLLSLILPSAAAPTATGADATLSTSAGSQPDVPSAADTSNCGAPVMPQAPPDTKPPTGTLVMATLVPPANGGAPAAENSATASDRTISVAPNALKSPALTEASAPDTGGETLPLAQSMKAATGPAAGAPEKRAADPSAVAQAAKSADTSSPATPAAQADAPKLPAPASGALAVGPAATSLQAPPPAAAPTVNVPVVSGKPAAIPTDAVAYEIKHQQSRGVNRFEIKLDPPELGRIEVRLEMREDGSARAHLTADRQDTLDLLQRDSRALERSLQALGLKTDRDGLAFSLRQDGLDRGTSQEQPSGGTGASLGTETGDEEIAIADPVVAASANSRYDALRINIVI